MNVNLDILKLMPLKFRAQIEENVIREDFRQSEIAAIQEEIRRYVASVNPPGRPKKGTRKGKLSKYLDSFSRTDDVIAHLFGESGETIRKRRAIMEAARTGPEKHGDLPDLMDREDRVEPAYSELRKRRRREEIERQKKDIAEGRIALPEGVFEVIVVDPPWPYEGNYDPDHWYGRVANPYPEISLDEIERLKLPAAEDCVLWLWTTHQFMRHSFRLIDAWGFWEVAILTWYKDRMGIGCWLRSQSEFCIMCVRGKPIVNLTKQTTVLEAPGREHSRKPNEFYRMVEDLCVGRKLDYFSREKREGWEVFGNEASKFQPVT